MWKTDLAGRANSNRGTTLKFHSHSPTSETIRAEMKKVKITAMASAYTGSCLCDAAPLGFVKPSTKARVAAFTIELISTEFPHFSRILKTPLLWYHA